MLFLPNQPNKQEVRAQCDDNTALTRIGTETLLYTGKRPTAARKRRRRSMGEQRNMQASLLALMSKGLAVHSETVKQRARKRAQETLDIPQPATGKYSNWKPHDVMKDGLKHQWKKKKKKKQR